MTMRVGIIGCGFFAQNHLHAWKEMADVALVAVCDRDRQRARKAADDFGVSGCYDDAAAMFAAEQLDLVDIATTMQSHRALADLAATHRVPMIVQKPLAPTWEDACAIVAAARAANVVMAVHENFRFQTPILAARAALPRIGTPVWARISFRTHYDVFAGQPYLAQEEKLIILDLGIHVLDLARVFLGEVARIGCETQQVRAGLRGEDMATMVLRHVNGATSVVDCSYSSLIEPDPFPQTLLHIEGGAGSLVLERDFRLTVTTGQGTQTHEVSSPLRPWTSQPWHVAQESVFNTQRHIVDALARGVGPETSGEDNLRTYALVMAAYRAAAEQRMVAPETP